MPFVTSEVTLLHRFYRETIPGFFWGERQGFKTDEERREIQLQMGAQRRDQLVAGDSPRGKKRGIAINAIVRGVEARSRHLSDRRSSQGCRGGGVEGTQGPGRRLRTRGSRL